MKHILLTTFWLLLSIATTAQQVYYVSPKGLESNDGSLNHPLRQIESALKLGKSTDSTEVRIYLRTGTYYLDAPLHLDGNEWKGKRLQLLAYENEPVVLSGAQQLSTSWKKHTKGIWKSKTNLSEADQLFINGKQRILARYPNYEEGSIFNGTAADALSAPQIKRWKSPVGGFIHALHAREWGDVHYRITSKSNGELQYTGGFQNNRPAAMHTNYRFVENIYEELDAPGEWFLNKSTGDLFYYPYPNEDLNQAKIEVSVLPHLLEIQGADEQPARNITIKGIHFTQTSRTFMAEYEPLLRSDWCIYRGGAVFMDRVEHCSIQNCEFSHLGGNAIFISRYADSCVVQSNHIHHIGASAICMVGDTSAVRSGCFKYEQHVPYELVDKTPGPRNELYPRRCVIEDNLIHDIGRIEKQVAGVQIQIAREIQVRHNTIYRTPRAAFNIGDGSFGGHILEYNDAFATVLETSDHGAFNSWGRDRLWQPSYQAMSNTLAQHPELILLDALFTTYIRYNRLRCDHGWDIDLDDGSSNYHIYSNICLSGGIKLREGFNRTVENNIVLNNTLHAHLWFKNNGDIVRRNIFSQAYLPIQQYGKGQMMDYNFFPSEASLLMAQKDSTDANSISGDLHFVDYKNYDFTLPKGSKAFDIGFENIPCHSFGVYSPHLRLQAEKPELSDLLVSASTNTEQVYSWQQAQIRPISTLGDRSAYGLPQIKGVVLTDVTASDLLRKAGLRNNDVVYSIYGEVIDSVEGLMRLSNKYKWKKKLELEYFRDQQVLKITVSM